MKLVGVPIGRTRLHHHHGRANEWFHQVRDLFEARTSMIYEFLIEGTGLELLEEGVKAEFGFYVNQTAFGPSESKAAERAIHRVRQRISMKTGDPCKNLALVIEESALSIKPWRMIWEQGFIFYPTSSHSSEPSASDDDPETPIA